MKYALRCFLLGLVVSVIVYFIERTTGDIFWPLIIAFPISWAIGGYLFQRWDLDSRDGIQDARHKS